MSEDSDDPSIEDGLGGKALEMVGTKASKVQIVVVEAEISVVAAAMDVETDSIGELGMDIKIEPAATETKQNKDESTEIVDVVSTASDKKPPASRIRLWTTLYSVFTTCIMSLLIGTTIAYSSPVVLELRQSPDPDFRLDSTLLLDLFGALSSVGATFGSAIGGIMADKWGRKLSIITNAVPYLLGYMIILASYLVHNGVVFKVLLMLGRFITGVGMGWAYVVVPVYIGEISPARLRGTLATFSELSFTIGALLMFGFGAIPGLRYYDLALIQIGIVTLFIFMVMWIPETPRWLLLKYHDQRRATAVMRCLRGPKYPRIKKEMHDIKSSISSKKPKFRQVLKMMLCEKTSLIPFLIVVFLYSLQELGGASAPIAYAGPIFALAGVSNPSITATYSVGVTLVVATILASVLVEILGRKILLALSSAGMFIGCIMLGVHLYVTRPSACSDISMLNSTAVNMSHMTTTTEASVGCNPHLYPLAIVSIFVFIFTSSIGIGPVPGVLLSEYLPLQVRGMAGGIAVAANWISAAIITGTYHSYSDLVEPYFTWWTYSVINFIGFIVIIFFVVETKGKTLEEVQDLLKNRTNPCMTCPSKSSSL